MSQKINSSVTNPTIAYVYRLIKDMKLVLQPDFQRKFVWTHEHQEAFIDTILNGLPFPEIYVCEGDVNIQDLTTTQKVIDGQQRLTTLRNFIDGNHEFLPTAHPLYKDLDDTQKEEFVKYQLVMRDLGKVDEVTVREIFRRINLTKFKLDDVEIHNAVYDGHFIQAAKDILDEISLEAFGVFRESEFTRMGDLHFILLVMATIENGGYFAQDKEVEVKISELNDEYPGRLEIITRLKRAFNLVKSLELPIDSMWFRKSNFFTLIVEVVNHIDRIPNNFKDKLLALEDNVISNRLNADSAFYQYYSYMYQATHARKARVVRADFFEKYCL